VQVSDSTTIGAAPASPAPRKDEPAAREGEAAHRRSSLRFRDALKRAAADPEGADEAAGTTGGGSVLFRTDPLRVGAPAASSAPLAASRAAAIDRLLVGTAGGLAEARIRIGAGALAGVEIQLTSTGAHAVTAQLLTAGAGSRQTLSVAMEEIRLRLRDKGIALGASVTRGRPAGEAGRDQQPDRPVGSGDLWPPR